ncbi:MAG: hypothetical protein KQH57_13055 [Actinomycetales bacterium]|nr:hypothetical protein [Actinomycetales bacterium]
MAAPVVLYLVVAVAALAVIGLVVLRARQAPPSRLSPLTGLGMALVVSAVVFGENRVIGYSLIGAGVTLAVIDIVRRRPGTGDSA